MTTWIATFSNDLDEKAPIRELEVEADSQTEATEALNTFNWDESWQGYSLVNVRRKRGGYRPGAGRKKGTQGTYGCETAVTRVPKHLKDDLPEILTNIEQFRELLNDWEAEASKSTSPRYDRARKLLAEIRALGF